MPKPRMSREQAIQRACEQIGIENNTRFQFRATEVEASNESIPFLANELRGDKNWMVEIQFRDLSDLAEKPELTNSHIRSMKIHLCRSTGNVMKVVSDWPQNEPRILEHPSGEEEMRQLREINVTYSGLPTAAPNVALLDVLGYAMGWGSNVKQVYACYVTEKSLRYDIGAWVIYLRGITPIAVGSPSMEDVISVHARNHMRTVIDASNGVALYSDTLPQPVLPLEERQ